MKVRSEVRSRRPLIALLLFALGGSPALAATLLPAPPDDARVMLPPPQALYATPGELRSVPLQWEAVLSSEVAGYAVERESETEGEFLTLTLLEGRFQTHWVDRAALEDGGRYLYRVCSFDAAKQVSKICSPGVEADTAPAPSPPPGLQAYSRLPRQVFLRWRPSTSATVAEYAIERSPSQGGPFERIATLEGRFSTSYLDRDLGNLRVFYYRVVSINPLGGEGPPSKVERGVTKPEPLPPIGLDVVGKELGSNHLHWTSNVEPDILGYKLFRKFENEEEAQLIATLAVGNNRVEDRGVPAFTEVTYSMVAFDGDGLESARSRPLTFTTIGYELEASAVGTRVVLRWNQRAEEGFSGARVYRSGRPGRVSPKELARLSSADGTFTDETAQPGKTLHYHIVLERADGDPAPPSRHVTVTIPDAKNP